MNARWTRTSASAASSSTAPRSSTSPWRYSVLRRPCSRGSNGRRAIPRTRPTLRRRSSARRNARPISPVGPVTATVSFGSEGILVVEDDTRRLALTFHTRLHGLDLAAGGPFEQGVGAVEAREPLEVLDRREDEQEVSRLAALDRPRRLEPAGVDDLLPVRVGLLAFGGAGEE